VNFSGSGNAAAGTSRADVFAAFMTTVQSRLRMVRGKLAAQKVKGGKSLLPMRFSVTEQIYGKEVQFNVSFSLIGSTFEETLRDARMFQSIPEYDHDKWRNSLANGAGADRGYAQLKISGGEEVLIDLCGVPTSTTLKSGLLPPGRPGGGLDNNPKQIETTLRNGGIGGLTTTLKAGSGVKGAGSGLEPENTWLMYEADLRVMTQNRVARHKRLPAEDPKRYLSARVVDSSSSTAEKVGNQQSDHIPEEEAKTDDVIQILGAPSYTLVLSGMARRLGYEAPPPRIVSINSVPVTQVSADIRYGQDGAIGEVPINLTRWEIVYLLPRKFEGGVPFIANPQTDVDGG
jgi:hypothetical protein